MNEGRKARVGLLVGTLVMTTAGIPYAFAAYAPAFKAQLRFSQEQVSTILNFINVGFSIGVTAGWVVDTFKPRIAAAVACALCTIGNGTLLLQLMGVLDLPLIALGMAYVLTTQGCICAYMSALITNIYNFTGPNRGKVVGYISAVFGSSPAIASAVYTFYKGPANTDPEDQDVKGFLLMVLIVQGAMNLLGVFFFETIKPDQEGELASESTKFAVAAEEPEAVQAMADARQQKGIQITHTRISPIRSPAYWLVGATFAFGISVCTIVMYNLTYMTKSLNFSHLDNFYTVIFPVCSALGRFAFGFISDALQPRRVSRSMVLLASLVPLGVTQILICIKMQNEAIFTANVMAAGLVMGSLFSLPPTIVSDAFGSETIGFWWGIVMCTPILIGPIFQWLLGRYYNARCVAMNTGHDCFGAECYTVINYTCAGAMLLSLVFCTALTFVEKHPHRYVVV